MLEIVDELLENKSDTEATDNEERTGLHHAASRQSILIKLIFYWKMKYSKLYLYKIEITSKSDILDQFQTGQCIVIEEIWFWKWTGALEDKWKSKIFMGTQITITATSIEMKTFSWVSSIVQL